MNVEVVAVGTELLLGQIVNGNAAEIGRRLARAAWTTTTGGGGDNLGRPRRHSARPWTGPTR